jgi:hypothetical protein
VSRLKKEPAISLQPGHACGETGVYAYRHHRDHKTEPGKKSILRTIVLEQPLLELEPLAMALGIHVYDLTKDPTEGKPIDAALLDTHGIKKLREILEPPPNGRSFLF